MRGAWLVLALVLPIVAAQSPNVQLATLTVDAFEKAAEPLKQAILTRVLARVSCALTDGAGGVPLTYRVTKLPAWATAVISPASDTVQVVSCNEGWGTANATLTVTANDQAPAFSPDTIEITLLAGSPGRAQTASANVTLSAAYYSVLDVSTPEAIATTAPGGSHTYFITATNFGNGETRVEWRLTKPADGVDITLPSAVTLESRQMGGKNTSITVPILASARNDSGFVNRVTEFEVTVTSAYALDDKVAGDTSQVAFLLTVRTGAQDGERRTAVPFDIIIAAPCLAALLLAAPAAARARSPRRRG